MKRKKKTTQEFVKDIHEKFGERYTILGEFIDWKTTILVRCNLCEHEWKVRPDALLKGPCPKCNKVARSKSEEQFKKEVLEVHGDKYIVKGTYQGYNCKVLMECGICGNEWDVLPGNLISKKSGCPKCAIEKVSESKRMTHEEFVDELEIKQPHKYTLLTEYIDSNTKILVRCNNDNYEWETLPGNLYKGVCPKCGDKVKRTTDIFKDEVEEKYEKEYSVLGEFINARTKVKIKHNVCGHEWDITPDKFLMQDRKCPNCFGTFLKSQEQFEEDLRSIYGDRYTVLGEYKNSRTHLLIRCNKCENEWDVMPTNILRGFGCPGCSVSKGEDKIRNYLDENNIEYKFQHTFADLYGDYGKPLRFDFTIFDKGSLICIIEYDGKLHYELGGIQTEEKFNLQKEYDARKNRYCESNNIPLHRIPYWEFDNIEDVLNNILGIKIA